MRLLEGQFTPPAATYLGKARIPFVDANLYGREDVNFIRPFNLVTLSGIKIALIGLVNEPVRGWRLELDEGLAGLIFKDPVQTFEELVKSAGWEPVDVIVVFGRLDEDTIYRLTRSTVSPDVIIVEEDIRPSSIDETGKYYRYEPTGGGIGGDFVGKTLVVIPPGTPTMVTEIDLQLKENKSIERAGIRIEKIDADIPKDSDITAALDSFYVSEISDIDRDYRLFKWAIYMRETQSKSFVGVAKCVECHELQYNQWLTTDHSMAVQKLEATRRQYSSKCTICHVVGQGYESGFQKLSDRYLWNVQCEMCHGPGSEHIQSPTRLNITKKANEKHCIECHDTEHSPFFNYKEYYQKILH